MKLFKISNGKLQRITAGIPEVKPNEVLVKIKAISLNYRDILVIEGLGHWKPTEDRIPGSDASGEVILVGSEVKHLKIGDRVTSLIAPNWEHGNLEHQKLINTLGGPDRDGVMAEYVALPENALCKIPDYLSYREAATLPVAALTAWNAVVEQSNLKIGSTILLIGTGGVSLFALQLAKLAGYNIIITSSNDDKLKEAKALGAHHTINYKINENWVEQVLNLTNGKGVNQVVDTVGGDHINLSLQCVKSEGIVSMVGVIGGKTQGLISTGTIMSKAAKIQGVETGSKEMYQRMLAAFDLHKIKPVISKTFDFDDTLEALSFLKKGGHFGKICIQLQG